MRSTSDWRTRSTRKIISLILVLSVMFGIYMPFIKNTETAGDIDPNKIKINRMYDNGENSAIFTLQSITAKTNTDVEVSIPAYSQFKAYVLENTLREENTYSFKFRGLDIEYNVEYKDDTSEPTVLMYKKANIYVINKNIIMYSAPGKKGNIIKLVEQETTIIVEYDINNGWVYCTTGNGVTGWMQLTYSDEEADYPTYNEASYLATNTTAKPSIFFDNIALYLNQFAPLKGITITTLTQG